MMFLLKVKLCRSSDWIAFCVKFYAVETRKIRLNNFAIDLRVMVKKYIERLIYKVVKHPSI